MDINESVAKNIRKYRKEKGLTQKQLANKLNLLNHSTVQKWESGKNCVSLQNIQEICNALGISMEKLMSLKTGNTTERKIDKSTTLFDDYYELEEIRENSTWQRQIRYVNKEKHELIIIRFEEFSHEDGCDNMYRYLTLKDDVQKSVDDIENIITKIKNMDISFDEMDDFHIECIEAYNIVYENDTHFYYKLYWDPYCIKATTSYHHFSLNEKKYISENSEELYDTFNNLAWFLARIIKYYGPVYDIIDEIYDGYYNDILPKLTKIAYIETLGNKGYILNNKLFESLIERYDFVELYEDNGYTYDEIQAYLQKYSNEELYLTKWTNKVNQLVISLINYIKSDTYYDCEIIISALCWDVLTPETIERFYNELYDGKTYYNFHARNFDKGCVVALTKNSSTPSAVLTKIAKTLPKFDKEMNGITELYQLEILVNLLRHSRTPDIIKRNIYNLLWKFNYDEDGSMSNHKHLQFQCGIGIKKWICSTGNIVPINNNVFVNFHDYYNNIIELMEEAMEAYADDYV